LCLILFIIYFSSRKIERLAGNRVCDAHDLFSYVQQREHGFFLFCEQRNALMITTQKCNIIYRWISLTCLNTFLSSIETSNFNKFSTSHFQNFPYQNRSFQVAFLFRFIFNEQNFYNIFKYIFYLKPFFVLYCHIFLFQLIIRFETKIDLNHISSAPLSFYEWLFEVCQGIFHDVYQRHPFIPFFFCNYVGRIFMSLFPFSIRLFKTDEQ